MVCPWDPFPIMAPKGQKGPRGILLPLIVGKEHCRQPSHLPWNNPEFPPQEKSEGEGPRFPLFGRMGRAHGPLNRVGGGPTVPLLDCMGAGPPFPQQKEKGGKNVPKSGGGPTVSPPEGGKKKMCPSPEGGPRLSLRRRGGWAPSPPMGMEPSAISPPPLSSKREGGGGIAQVLL